VFRQMVRTLLAGQFTPGLFSSLYASVQPDYRTLRAFPHDEYGAGVHVPIALLADAQACSPRREDPSDSSRALCRTIVRHRAVAPVLIRQLDEIRTRLYALPTEALNARLAELDAELEETVCGTAFEAHL
jgi:hypothetical protein